MATGTGTVSITAVGTAKTENFNTLSNTAGSTTNTALPTGWYITETGGGARDNEQYAVDTGGSTTGDIYSYGAAASTDRALGQLRSGTLIPVFGAKFTNDTGATITSLDIGYRGEEWRLGFVPVSPTPPRQDKMDFQISFNATSIDDPAATWIDVDQLDFLSPNYTTTAGAKDGNAAGNFTDLATTLNNLSIAAGATFFIRWTDIDASGADDGLAIDDFSITAHTAAVATPNLTITDVTHNEGANGTVTYTFTVSLDAPAPAGGVTFDIATADGTATTADGDYVARSLTSQTIAAGNTSYTFDVTVNGDAVIEANETFFVNVTSVTGATVTDGQGMGTITNDDTPLLSIDDVTKTEGDTGTITYTFTVSLDRPAPTGGVTFDIATADGTATIAGGDYVARALTGQTIPAGSTSYTFDVTVNGDINVESNENFVVNVTNVVNASVADGQGIGTITDNDVPPTLSIADVTKTEGDSGTQTYTFTVSLSSPAPAGGVTFDIATADGTATSADGDYVARALTGQTIPAGSTSYTFDVTVGGDLKIEPNEAFFVNVTNVTGASVGDGQAAGTITNNDVLPTVSIGDATVVEGNGGVSYLVFTVSLNKAWTDAVTVDYATSNGTATAGADYLAIGGSLSFAAGETSKTVSVPVIGDHVAELAETVNVTLSNVSGATIADGSAVGTITDDDFVNYFSLASGNFSENWTDTSRISANDDWSKIASIRGYLGDIDPAGAVTGVDPRTLTGANNGAIDVIANLNATTSTSGGVGEFQLADPTIGLQGSGTADAPSIVLFLDASGRTDIHLTANLRDIDTTADNAVQQVAVQYRTDPNGAWTNAPGGYFADVTTGGSATQVTALDITLPPEANNAPTLQVRILTTNAAGNDEWVGIDDIVVSSAQAATPSYAIADAAVFEGTTFGDPTPIAFTVTRTGDASQAGDVDYAITFPGGGFSAGASDLTSELSGSVHFNAGETSATITLGIVADFTPEADEAFTVTLSNPSSGTITHASATGTIVNDDGAPPFVSISDVTQVEGDTGTSVFTFTVTRTGGTGAFSVDYATADGSASAASDYAAKSGTLDFAAGETSKTISVTVNGDLAGETSETFSVNLANPTGFAVLADATGTGTILNDDVIPIYQIQGSGHTSPLAGQGVKTQGVVTAVAFNGYYIQDPTGDGNDATSDGVFVFTGTAPSGIAVGDLVQVTGTVNEFVAGTGDLSVTEITSPTASVLSTGNALPAATLIGVGGRMPPTENGPGNGLGNALAFYESMEGMRVTVKAPLVVSDTNSFGETWVVASGGAGATGVNDRGGITLSAGDLNPERIQIDDDSTIFSGYSPHHTTGDLLSDVTGILNYSHTSYEVLVTQAVTTTTDVTLGQETTSLAGDLNHLTVASYNIENADITDGQGKFDILAQNIVYNLAAPDIIGLQEIQDADGPGNGSDLSGQVTAQLLIDAIKAIGGPNYVYIEIAPTTPNTSGGEPGGNIRPGFLYNADRVTYVEGSAHILTDPAFNGSRKPLIADFLFNGQKVELIDVHFTSRLGSSELEGATQPPIDAGDSSRTAMGVAVHNYIAGALATDPSLKLGVVGDFNGFYFEGAVGAIENGGVLTDLHRTLAPEERYSYLFDGNNQAIDHIIVTQNLADGAQFDAVHLNSQFPNNSTRPTDHDPVIARFSIPNPNPQLDLDAQAPGTGASNAVVEQDAVATFIAPNATVSDADSPDFAGGTLTVTISANGQTGDVLSIGDTPAITVSDGKLLYNGTEIATVAGGGDATTPLVVTFEASANAAAVQDVVRAIAFAHDSDAPSSAVRTVHYALTDGDGGSGAADASVTVQPVNDAPELTAPTQAGVTYTEGDPSVAILQGVTLSDPDLPASFTGGSLVIDVAGATGGLNLKAGSNFVINDNGDGSFSLAIVVTGTQIGFGTISGFGTTHLAITGLTGAATLARVNDLIDDFTFVKAGDAVEDATGTITVTFTDGNNVGSVLDTALCDEQAQGLSVVGVDDAVVVDLNGEAAGSNNAVTFTEGDSPVALAPAGTVTDPDTCSPDFAGGTVSVQIGDGATADDLLLISGPCFVVDEGVLYYQGTEVGTVSGTVTGSLTVVFNDQGSPALAQALVEAVAFANYSSAPTEGDRVVTFTLTDSHGAASAPVTATVTLHGIDRIPVGVPDHVFVAENEVGQGNLFFDNGNGPDTDPDGPPLKIEAVNGDPNLVGKTITLASGALLTVNADGSYSYDPNHMFDALAQSSTNAANSHANETFTYTLAGTAPGTETLVTVTINGVGPDGQTLYGDAGNDTITGSESGEFIDLSQGGNDTAYGQGGGDGFYFGAAFNLGYFDGSGMFIPGDHVDGGDGRDVVALQGDYSGGLVLDPTTLTHVETLTLLSHSDDRFGGGSADLFSYDITTSDAIVAAGQQLIVNASTLAAGENFTFDGSAETDGSFFIYGGKGDDHLTGGSGVDVFFFAEDGRWGANDTVNGGGGNDIVVLRGSYEVTFDGTDLSGVETVSLLSGKDARFYPAGTPFHYDITTGDSLLAAGQTITFNGGNLGANETLVFDGSAESEGSFRVFAGAGNDVLHGGRGDDLLFGGGSGDTLTGGGGNDVFRYQNLTDSDLNEQDGIQDFDLGDKIDLTWIDADVTQTGDQAFHFIGSDAFGHQAGELRAFEIGHGLWEVQADVDGDGNADFQVSVVVIDSNVHPLGGGDFLL